MIDQTMVVHEWWLQPTLSWPFDSAQSLVFNRQDVWPAVTFMWSGQRRSARAQSKSEHGNTVVSKALSTLSIEHYKA